MKNINKKESKEGNEKILREWVGGGEGESKAESKEGRVAGEGKTGKLEQEKKGEMMR